MHQSPEQPRQAGPDWYAVDADGESALRITPGFTIGETASGSLALNDPCPDHQWLEFHLDPDGLRVDIIVSGRGLVDANGTVRRAQTLDHGARLALPNNTLHVSRDLRPPGRPGPLFELVEHQQDAEQPPPDPAPDADPRADPETRTDPEARTDPQTTSASRGPAVLEVVEDLRQQLGISGPGGDQNQEPPRVQVAAGMTRAERPQPAMLNPETLRRAFDTRTPPPQSRRAPQPPREPPDLMDEPSDYRSYRRRRGGLRPGPALLGAGVLVLAAAIVLRGPELVTVLEDLRGPTDAADATPSSNAATPDRPDATAPEAADSWLATSDTLDVRAAAPTPRAGIGEPPAAGGTAEPQPVEPAGIAARRGTDGSGSGTGYLAPESNSATVTPGASDPFETNSASSATTGAYQPGTTTAGTTATPTQPTPAPAEADPVGPAQNAAPPGAAADTGAFAPQLALARNLMQEGEITTPRGANAVSVLAGILERAPDHQGARALMAQCSDRLVAAAVSYHQSGLEYQARNTLEEVLSFAPDHAEANRLWRNWVGTPP